MHLLLFSDMANYKKEIRDAKYNRRGDVSCNDTAISSYHYFLTSLFIQKKYVLPNATGEVMWSLNVTAIEHEREKCESSLF